MMYQCTPQLRVLTPLGEGDVWFIETQIGKYTEYHVMLDRGFLFIFTHDLIRKAQNLTDGIFPRSDEELWRGREKEVQKLRSFFGVKS